MKYWIILLAICCYSADSAAHKDIKSIEKTRLEILTMAKEDRSIRCKLLEQVKSMNLTRSKKERWLAEQLNAVDLRNTKKVKQIFNQWGWPSKEKFDDATENAFWLLVQHAYYDLPLQRKVLNTLKKVKHKNALESKYYAYLYDRVQIRLNRLQRFGTQGKCIGPKNWQVFPLEDKKNINQIRAGMFLGSFNDYHRVMNDLCY